MIEETENRVTRALTRGVTRRTAFQRAMRASLIVGGVVASPLAFFEGKASASYCGVYGVDPEWGCVCNPATPNCGGSVCSGSGNCGASTRVRCNGWPSPNSENNHCWCSTTCNYGGGVVGHRVCCDCWIGGHSGNCYEANGDSPCICVNWVPS
jgi:hypothetical protein